MTSDSKAPAPGEFQYVWKGDDQELCVFICSLLRNVEIPFRVEQHHRQFFKGLDESFIVYVPTEMHDRAKKIIEQDALHMAEEPRSKHSDRRADKPEGAETPELHHDPGYRPAQGAASEISSQRSSVVSSMIESALTENDIASRTEIGMDGQCKIYVTSKDRGRAREIAKQIETESEPE